MRLMTIVYVSDMDRSVKFYRSVVPDAAVLSESPYWTGLDVGGSTLALHHADEPKTDQLWVELALVANAKLEQVIDDLGSAGISIEGGITDQPFGRSILIRDPDGLPIQINEHSD